MVPMPLASLLDPLTGAGLGPMWFVFFLLLATFAYLIWTGYYRPDQPEFFFQYVFLVRIFKET